MQEKNIIDAIKAGDEQAMEKIICRYSRLLWSIVGAVLSQVGTTEDMEECVADVFIDLWEHPQKYDESRGSLKAWLSVIARNKAIDRYRQKTKIQTIPLEETVLAQEKYQRTVLEEAYQQAYENLPEFQKGQVVSAVSPVLPGNRIQKEMCLTVQDPPEGVIWDERISPEKQYELMGLNWSTYDSFGRLIGAQGEYAMVLSVQVPLQDYADGTRELPLFYVMVYDREETQKDDACAFIHGRPYLLRIWKREKYLRTKNMRLMM